MRRKQVYRTYSYRADIPFSLEEKEQVVEFIEKNGLVARKWLRTVVLKAIDDQRGDAKCGS